MDECDRSRIAAEKYLGGAISARRAKVNQGGKVLDYCIDCLQEIGQARRKNALRNGDGCVRCITCQAIFEENR